MGTQTETKRELYLRLAAKNAFNSEAKESNRLHAEIIGLAQSALDKAIQNGEILSGVRSRMRHGEWLPWVRANLMFSDQTARNYIRVYEHREELKFKRVLNLTDAYAALLPPASKASKSDSNRLPSVELAIDEDLLSVAKRMVRAGGDWATIRDHKLYESSTFAEFCRKDGASSEYVTLCIDFYETACAARDRKNPDIMIEAWNADLRERLFNYCIRVAEKERLAA